MKSEDLGATDTSNRHSYMCPVFIPNLLTLCNLQPFWSTMSQATSFRHLLLCLKGHFKDCLVICEKMPPVPSSGG